MSDPGAAGLSSPTQTAGDRARLQQWLPYCRLEGSHPKLRLLCFAHAGGSALAFQKWPDKLPRAIQVCAVQLPGREARLQDRFVKRVPELMEELWHALLPLLDRPVALLGNSLGAKLAFEFARRMESKAGAPEVHHLFVCGARAPHMLRRDPIYDLPDEEFMQRLHDFGGTPKEVLHNPEIMEFFSPRLRADIELNDTYTFEPGIPLTCPITAWAGNEDSLVPADSLQGWGQHTRGRFRSQIVQGTHFALFEREGELLPQIRHELAAFV